MSSILDPNSTILVTGANGMLGAHIVNQLLQRGFRVRGTSRTEKKIQPLAQKWQADFGDRFEAVIIEDLAKEGALKDAMKDTSAVAHVASDLSFGTDIKLIDGVVAMTESILKQAQETSTVKRVVLTSSLAALIVAEPDLPGHVDEKSWNEAAIKLARELPEDDPRKAPNVYYASKAKGEQAAWRFVEQHKPHFELNAVIPSVIMGPFHDKSQSGSTTSMIQALFEGEKGFTAVIGPQQFISAEDCALLHVGALTLPSVKGQRLLGTAGAFNWDQVLDIFRKLHPSKRFVENYESRHDLTTYKSETSTEVLKRLGRDRWMGLEASVESIVGRE